LGLRGLGRVTKPSGPLIAISALAAMVLLADEAQPEMKAALAKVMRVTGRQGNVMLAPVVFVCEASLSTLILESDTAGQKSGKQLL
jgi:hypothetical protein